MFLLSVFVIRNVALGQDLWMIIGLSYFKLESSIFAQM